jgi:pSer/pThr/pTyr-binding forkhead associated (FHA) protein
MDDPTPDSFSEATGLVGSLGVRIEGPGPEDGTRLELHRPFLVVGRDRSADLVIDRSEVSRHHAYFQVVDGEVFCVDLVSRTGIRWAGEARPAGWVDRDQGVEIGPYRVRLEHQANSSRASGRDTGLPISRSFRWGQLTDARIDFLGADSSREPWTASRVLILIGRSPICRIRFPGPGISRIHAALLRTPDGVWVVDLQGTGAVRVGDLACRSKRLEDRDEVAVGAHRFRVRLGSEATRTDLARTSSGHGGRPGRVKADRIDLNGFTDPLTARLLQEFDRMHQRTTQQFQQALLMMFQMHQDQMGLIRDELSRLDQLEEEQKRLQAEMARGGPSTPRLALRLVSGEPRTPPIDPDEAIDAECGRIQPLGGNPTAGPPVEGSDRKVGQSSSDRTHRPASAAPSGTDQHALLARRIAEIKEERQGLWQKLLSSLAGEGPEAGYR